ncbi:MAG: hypothetical protein BroJett018_37740 [Chloroflexota bacterium]|nr:hypothetical protein [Chloroflexota bacterium]NOG64433.1 hypothetical protein [Chloroflexota bacterium]GIK65980.1 MAG: hypothetical protein BroJett018_37740 [Chloroflexota bacterium]
MFKKDPHHMLDLPRDLTYDAGFPLVSLVDDTAFYVVQFERRKPDQPDQYYVFILDINAPVLSSDPVAVADAALVWDCADSRYMLSRKISAWLGEAL